MKRSLLLLVLAAPTALPAAAQEGCTDPGVSIVRTAPPLDGYNLLFRQASVSFYARVPGNDAGGAAELVVHNANEVPMEVSYGVEVQLRGEGAPRAMSMGRHCAQIPPRAFALSSDQAPAGAIGVRVRNLTIANLTPAQQTPAAAAPAPSAASTPAAEAPVATAPTAPITLPVAPLPSGSAAPAPASPRGDAPDTALRPDPTVEEVQEPAWGWSDAGPWAVRIAKGVFLVTSMVVVSVAGIGLLLPVVAALALLIGCLGAAAARRLGGARSG